MGETWKFHCRRSVLRFAILAPITLFGCNLLGRIKLRGQTYPVRFQSDPEDLDIYVFHSTDWARILNPRGERSTPEEVARLLDNLPQKAEYFRAQGIDHEIENHAHVAVMVLNGIAYWTEFTPKFNAGAPQVVHVSAPTTHAQGYGE